MMLVLSRRIGQRIRLKTWQGDVIWLEVCDIDPSRGKVRIGIEAPPEVIIHRAEILDEPTTNKGDT
jgi:carbon storage regulator CsrA